MRRWHWIVGGMVMFIVGTGYWHFAGPVEPRPDPRQHSGVKDDGNAEASDVIEPLVVEGGFAAMVETPEPPLGPPSRVSLTPGMHQPPRPDADRPVVMPYAD